MKKNYQYRTCCVHANGKDIEQMTNRSRPVTWETLIRHVAVSEIEAVLPNNCPKLKNDWGVRFYKSVFCGAPCYYIDHSAIEYIFTNQ